MPQAYRREKETAGQPGVREDVDIPVEIQKHTCRNIRAMPSMQEWSPGKYRCLERSADTSTMNINSGICVRLNNAVSGRERWSLFAADQRELQPDRAADLLRQDYYYEQDLTIRALAGVDSEVEPTANQP